MTKIYAEPSSTAQQIGGTKPEGWVEVPEIRPDGDWVCRDIDGVAGVWADNSTAVAYEQWKKDREDLVKAITVTVDGMVFDGDEDSQNRMARAVSAATSTSETTQWRLNDNTVATVTAAQLKEALRLAGLAQTAVWMP